MQPLDQEQPLPVIQAYVAAMEVERGFADRDVLSQALLLGEEVGELNKAIRKRQANLTVDPHSRVGEIDEELADILIVMCSIANRYGIDLDEALRKKEARNELRRWT
jgi:NTP pyrophosphatase (non-canonical NTP hydrolase)